jgi:heme/copper-type cytochrome/quinol oxidase subunit 4
LANDTGEVQSNLKERSMKRYMVLFVVLSIVFAVAITYLTNGTLSPFHAIEIAFAITALIAIKFR